MHKFDPSKIEILLSKDRVKGVVPDKFLKEAGLKKGDTFADIGCGPGFFAIPGAKVVGKRGKVYAIDTQEEMLKKLSERRPPSNVFLIRSGENSMPVDDSIADFALLAYVLHEAEDKALFLREVKRIVKEKGKVVVVDWEKIREEYGPPFEERVSREEAIKSIKDAGFSIKEITSLNPSNYRIDAVKRSL